MRLKHSFFILFLILLSLPYEVLAEIQIAEQPANFSLSCNQASDAFLQKCKLKIKKNEEKWKIYANHPSNAGFGLNALTDETRNQNIKKVQIHWVEADITKYDNTYVYSATTEIPVDVYKDNNNPFKIALKINYAACNDYCGFFSQDIIYDSLLNNTSVPSPNLSLSYVIIMAILGGLILNFMPCVLPVVGLKISHIAAKSHDISTNIRKEVFFVYLGIIFSFLVFGLFTIILRLLGRIADWGMHFQEPIFVVFIIIITAFAAINAFGAFEINLPGWLTNFINSTEKRSKQFANNKILVSDFLYGCFLVLLATPCTAPFLSTAVAFAMTQNISTIFIIYIAIGFGMGIPYMAIILSPNLIKRILPKPGIWMQYLKVITAILLSLTCLWFCYVLSTQIEGITFRIVILVLLSALVLMLWSRIKRFLIHKKAIVIFCFILFLSGMMIYKPVDVQQEQDKIQWEKFGTEKLAEYIASKDITIVNITSNWCMTCKVNDKRVFNDRDIQNLLRNPNIGLLQGDYTTRSDEITNYISQHNRSGIPLTVVYGPNNKDSVILPVIFNKQEFLNIIDKIESQG